MFSKCLVINVNTITESAGKMDSSAVVYNDARALEDSQGMHAWSRVIRWTIHE